MYIYVCVYIVGTCVFVCECVGFGRSFNGTFKDNLHLIQFSQVKADIIYELNILTEIKKMK